MSAKPAAGGLTAVVDLVNRVRANLAMVGRCLWRGVVGMYYSDDLTHAASIAYYGLMSIFPVFMLVFSVLGSFTSEPVQHKRIAGWLLEYFPAQFDFLVRQLDALPQMRLRLGVGGLLALVWAALGFFHALSSAVNHAWGVETPRSYLGQKAFALVMLLTAGLLLTAALLLASVVEIAKARWFESVVVGAPALGALTSLPARWGPPALFSVVVGLIFYFAPNTKVRFRDVWIGAILTGLLWKGAFAGFSFYIRDMSRFSLVHGSVAAVVVFLIWVYVSAVILLYGVEFTVSWTQLREERRRSPDGGASEHAEAFV